MPGAGGKDPFHAVLPTHESADGSWGAEVAGVAAGKHVDRFLDDLFDNLRGDMDAVLQTHLSELRQDWEQRLQGHVELIKQTVSKQQHQHHVRAGNVEVKPCPVPIPVDDVWRSSTPQQLLDAIIVPSSALQVGALETKVMLGKAESERTVLSAGFLGGAGLGMRFFWSLWGFASIWNGLAGKMEFPKFSEPTLEFATYVIYSGASVLWGSCCIARAYFMHTHKWQSGYLAVIFMLAQGGILYGLCGCISLIASLTVGCDVLVDEYLYKESEEFCVPLFVAQSFLATASCGVCLRIAHLLYVRKRDAAASEFLMALIAFSIMQLISVVFNVAHGWAREVKGFNDTLWLIVFVSASVFWVYIPALRRKQAWKVVFADCELYDKRWSDVMQRDEEVLGNIAMCVTEIVEDIATSTDDAKMSNPLLVGETAIFMQDMRHTILSLSQSTGTNLGLQQLLSSLPLLYAQAFMLNEYFQSKCAEWAGSDGKHTHTTVKKQGRAIQKLWRSYSGHPQCLLDLVRSSITCDTTSQILVILRRIRADPAASLLRVKNRFHPRYDSALSAGYRNISINLIVVDRVTCKACTASHICELQLGLREMNELKSEGGHKRFVSFRDLRAE